MRESSVAVVGKGLAVAGASIGTWASRDSQTMFDVPAWGWAGYLAMVIGLALWLAFGYRRASAHPAEHDS